MSPREPLLDWSRLLPHRPVPRPGEPCRRGCGRRAGGHGRGLCSACWRDPSIRALYPVVERSRRGPAIAVCLHCRECKVTRPRGLCRRCHADRSIRRRYAPLSPHGHRDPSARVPRGPRPLPRKPTSAPPGSAEKIRVLRERIGRGLDPWHPLDAPMDPESAALSRLYR